MDYDQKEFLELLHPFKSDETMKARRNVSTISFLVLSLWVLDISIKDVRFFGITLKESSEIGVLSIAIFLLIYWLGMFLLAWFQDREIQKERSYILKSQMSNIISQFEKLDAKKEEEEVRGRTYIGHNYGKFKASYGLIKAQRERTEKAGKLAVWIKRLELSVPVILAVIALFFLLFGMVSAFPPS